MTINNMKPNTIKTDKGQTQHLYASVPQRGSKNLKLNSNS